MNIAICDDDKFFRNQVLDATNEYILQQENKAIQIETFSHAEDLLEAVYKKGGFDIYILDVVMPDINGIKLGEQLRQDGYNGKIIYLTSSEEFAVNSYKVKAFDYLLKPLNKTEFFSTLNEAISAIFEKSDKNILIKTKQSTVKLCFENIMYAELNRRIICFHLVNGSKIESIQLRSTFTKAISELLEDRRFCLCSTSMVINLQNIVEVGADYAILKGSKHLNLGRKAIRAIRSAWCEFCMNEVKSK